MLGVLKIRKSKKILAGHQTFLWKTPQPGHQTLLETLLTLTMPTWRKKSTAASSDMWTVAPAIRVFELSPAMPLGCFARGTAAPTLLMGIDVVKNGRPSAKNLHSQPFPRFRSVVRAGYGINPPYTSCPENLD